MSDASHIRQWLVSHAGAWRSVVQRVAALRAQHHASVDEALGAVDAYRGLARDLATARRVAPNSRMTAGLESLYGQLHGVVNRRPRGGIAALRLLFADQIPTAAYELRARIASMGLLMALSALAGWWLVTTFPTLISLFASDDMIEHVEQGHLWTEGIINVMPSSILSIGILANNIVVSVLAFCAGIFLGLGTLYLVAMNGLMLGRGICLRPSARIGAGAVRVHHCAWPGGTVRDLHCRRERHRARRVHHSAGRRIAPRFLPGVCASCRAGVAVVRAIAGRLRIHRRLCLSGSALSHGQPNHDRRCLLAAHVHFHERRRV